jgi:hypothetical protein
MIWTVLVSGLLKEISISLRNGLQPAPQTKGLSNFPNLQDIRKIRKIRKTKGFLAFSHLGLSEALDYLRKSQFP